MEYEKKHVKTGGRKKGTPNKVTALARKVMADCLARYTEEGEEGGTLFMEDFLELEPRDRMRVATEFVRIIMPKHVSMDDTSGATTLEQRLAALAAAEGDVEAEVNEE